MANDITRAWLNRPSDPEAVTITLPADDWNSMVAFAKACLGEIDYPRGSTHENYLPYLLLSDHLKPLVTPDE